MVILLLHHGSLNLSQRSILLLFRQAHRQLIDILTISWKWETKKDFAIIFTNSEGKNLVSVEFSKSAFYFNENIRLKGQNTFIVLFF